MTEEIKKYKLYYLQLKYNKIINIINEFETHYNILINNNLIDTQNNFSNLIYDIIKNLNSFYNNLINYYLENTNTDIDNLIKQHSNNIILKMLDEYNNLPSDISIYIRVLSNFSAFSSFSYSIYYSASSSSLLRSRLYSSINLVLKENISSLIAFSFASKF